MKFNAIAQASLAMLAWSCAQGASASDFRFNQCNMSTGNNSDTIRYVVPLGDFYVPRDVPVGTVIGQAFQGKSVDSPGGMSVYCNRDKWESPELANPVFLSEVIALGRPYTGPLPSVGRDLTGKVFETSVQGVGIALEFSNPYFGPRAGDFYTPTRLAPFSSTNYFPNQPVGPSLRFMGVFALLVKTGSIPAGTHTIAPDILFEANMLPGVPKAYTVATTGTVRQAQCTLSSNNPDLDKPVDLGEWSTDDFSGPGSFTPSQSFVINLQDCESNPGNDRFGFATAHVTLNGTDGSTIIDRDIGLFSLDSSATARGVGIQVLKSDGATPVTLGAPFPVIRIAPSGNTRMEFSARLYQLPDGTPLRAGTTKGALNFTVSYL